METKYLLTRDRTSLLNIGLETQNKTEDDLERSITEVKDWIKKQNVPEIPNDNIISNFIFMNKFQLDQAKDKLEMYYKVRKHFPDLFSNKHPKLPHMQKIPNVIYNIPLPQTTKEGYRVSVIQIQDQGTEGIDVLDILGLAYYIAEIRLHEDVANGEVYVYDVANMKLDLIVQFTPSIIKKILFILEKVYSNRVKQFNYINAPPVAQALITIVKTLLKPKLAKRLNVHPDLDSLYQYVPKEILPKDYGGGEMSLYELNELWKKKLLEYNDRFDTLEAMSVTTEPISSNENDLFGIQGSFKTLNID